MWISPEKVPTLLDIIREQKMADNAQTIFRLYRLFPRIQLKFPRRHVPNKIFRPKFVCVITKLENIIETSFYYRGKYIRNGGTSGWGINWVLWRQFYGVNLPFLCPW